MLHLIPNHVNDAALIFIASGLTIPHPECYNPHTIFLPDEGEEYAARAIREGGSSAERPPGTARGGRSLQRVAGDGGASHTALLPSPAGARPRDTAARAGCFGFHRPAPESKVVPRSRIRPSGDAAFPYVPQKDTTQE